MIIPCYPDFIPLDLDLKEILHPRLSLTFDGVSEFTFAGLYLFRKRYNYRISRHREEGGFIISGEQILTETSDALNEPEITTKKTFFMTPCSMPDSETLASLFSTHDYWKNISDNILKQCLDNYTCEKLHENNTETSFLIPELNLIIEEDRDNFDYLYNRSDLAELSGKKFHKKKNHVNNFLQSYPDHEQKPMSRELIPKAIDILDRWKQNTFMRGKEGDYIAAKEALELFDSLTLKGTVFFINSKPAAYCLGESISRGRMFAIHFEKANEEYRGIYQFMNQVFAASLPRFFTLINREQDLGNEGLRQAKMTYRPCGFVKKYTGKKL